MYVSFCLFTYFPFLLSSYITFARSFLSSLTHSSTYILTHSVCLYVCLHVCMCMCLSVSLTHSRYLVCTKLARLRIYVTRCECACVYPVPHTTNLISRTALFPHETITKVTTPSITLGWKLSFNFGFYCPSEDLKIIESLANLLEKPAVS